MFIPFAKWHIQSSDWFGNV